MTTSAQVVKMMVKYVGQDMNENLVNETMQKYIYPFFEDYLFHQLHQVLTHDTSTAE